CFEFQAKLDCLRRDMFDNVVFTGVPQFDDFGAASADSIDEKAVILVDNQLHNAGLFGWTPSRRREWVQELHNLAVDLDLRLYVKLHPGDKSGAWDSWLQTGRVEIVDFPRLVELARTTRII